MAKITALSPQKHDPERVNVELDGQFAFGVSRLLASARSFFVGQDLSLTEIEEIRNDDTVEQAYNAALNFLTYRPRSAREIAQYLRKRKTEPAAIEAVVQRLQRSGLLDDGEFARFWVENRQSFRPKGTRALRAELRQKGLETGVIEEALDELGDEEPAAVKAGHSKLRSYARLDKGQFLQKMTAFLQRRGFPFEVSARASQLLYEESQENPV